MNTELPIIGFEKQILETIEGNPVTIIVAETGAGKSTQVPQFLLEEGYTLVVTQPRRLATRTVAERVADEVGCQIGGEVGYRTAFESADSRDTRCLFVTDGLALVREIMGNGSHGVLVLDEVHEWNMNIEVLVAWVKHQQDLGQLNFKVVLMSATLEAEKLSMYFNKAPIISVPGRQFPVEERRAVAIDNASEALPLLQQGRNVLIFEPGKREIGETIELLKRSGVSAEILPLHGELDSVEQRKCFAHYPRPKCIVSTNVAQTSITIDDIDAVVDGGKERRVEIVDGVESLRLLPISTADSLQRKGRAGRTKEGIYIDRCDSHDRPAFPKAEILRVRLDQTVLRLAEAGFDAEGLSFFHQPPIAEIHEAKRALKALGCIGSDGFVTTIGHQVAKLPVSVKFGRMIVEADRLGVVGDVLTVAAVLEQGDITARPAKGSFLMPPWRSLVPNEKSSDVLAQLAIFNLARKMSKDEMKEKGVFPKAFFRAKEIRQHLYEAIEGRVRSTGSSGNRDNILKAVCAGMVDHLYHREMYSGLKNGDDEIRTLADSTVVVGGEWLIGIPWNLEIKGRYGNRILKLVRMATVIDPAWLTDIAPHLIKVEGGLSPRYDRDSDVIVSTSKISFNGQVIRQTEEATPDHPDASKVFAKWIADEIES